jgi:lipopolysaccharide transport system ATP-binding protein
MSAVANLTQRCLLLADGRCAANGPSRAVIAEYTSHWQELSQVHVAPASPSEPRVTRVAVRTSDPHSIQVSGQPMEIIIEITTPIALTRSALSFQVCNEFHQPVLHMWTFDVDRPMCRAAGVWRLTCRIPRLRLYLGRYSLTVHFGQVEKIENVCPFEVTMYGLHREMTWTPGACMYLEDGDWLVEIATAP